MVCRKCNGRGNVWLDDQTYVKCPECIGGVASCCDVDTELTNFSEPLLKPSTKNDEPIVVTKTIEYPTGYEIPYPKPTPHAQLINEVAQLILSGINSDQ